MTKAAQSERIAWAGWSLAAKPDWRPLRITGDWFSGTMTIGDGERSVLQVAWWRPKKRRRVAAEKRFQRWLQESSLDITVQHHDPDDRFALSAARLDGDGHRLVWCGWSRQADLLVDLRYEPDLPAASRRFIQDRAVPSLDVGAIRDPLRWQVFGHGFVSPPNFRYMKSKLLAGDVNLLFHSPAGEHLMLRQVYPADLALERRELLGWTELPVFDKGLHYHWNETRELAPPAHLHRLAERRGVRSVSQVFRFAGRMYLSGTVAHDTTRNKILTALLETRRRGGDDNRTLEAVTAMNGEGN